VAFWVGPLLLVLIDGYSFLLLCLLNLFESLVSNCCSDLGRVVPLPAAWFLSDRSTFDAGMTLTALFERKESPFEHSNSFFLSFKPGLVAAELLKPSVLVLLNCFFG